MKVYNVMTDRSHVFDLPVKNGERTYNNTQKVTDGQGDNYITGCLLDYLYLKKL